LLGAAPGEVTTRPPTGFTPLLPAVDCVAVTPPPTRVLTLFTLPGVAGAFPLPGVATTLRALATLFTCGMTALIGDLYCISPLDVGAGWDEVRGATLDERTMDRVCCLAGRLAPPAGARDFVIDALAMATVPARCPVGERLGATLSLRLFDRLGMLRRVGTGTPEVGVATKCDKKIATNYDPESSSSSLTFNVTRTQSEKDHILFTALQQCWTVPMCQTTSGYMDGDKASE